MSGMFPLMGAFCIVPAQSTCCETARHGTRAARMRYARTGPPVHSVYDPLRGKNSEPQEFLRRPIRAGNPLRRPTKFAQRMAGRTVKAECARSQAQPRSTANRSRRTRPRLPFSRLLYPRTSAPRRLGRQFGFWGAFTLIELLVVVGIIGLLAAMVLAAVSRVESSAHRTACLSNVKQFCVALQLYAGDHADYLVANLDGENIPLGETWVEGWLGMSGPDCTNTVYLQRSLLGSYLGAAKVWQCPSAEPVTLWNVTQPRVRTVSLNCFMGSPVKSPAATTYLKLGEIIQPSPAQALTFLEERVETINDASFAIQWDFEQKKPAEWMLRDKPEVLHDGSGNLGFAEGHVESHRWLDARTLNPPRDDAISPTNRDVLWLEQHGTWRER